MVAFNFKLHHGKSSRNATTVKQLSHRQVLLSLERLRIVYGSCFKRQLRVTYVMETNLEEQKGGEYDRKAYAV